jgi:hypothetical protein
MGGSKTLFRLAHPDPAGLPTSPGFQATGDSCPSVNESEVFVGDGAEVAATTRSAGSPGRAKEPLTPVGKECRAAEASTGEVRPRPGEAEGSAATAPRGGVTARARDRAGWKGASIFRPLKTFLATLACVAVLTGGGAGPGVWPSPLAAAAELSREYLIKAAFLYNFAKFTEWPETAFAHANAPLTICVVGRDPFGAALDSLNGKIIKGRTVAIFRLPDTAGAAACQVIFISESERERLATILRSLRGQPVLTVADMPDFARAGGIINLKTNPDERIRFDINVGIAQQAGLRLSSKLLSLADDTYN